MKAIVYDRYGSPDVLQLREVDTPALEENEVLVRIHAAALNPLDWHFVRGKPLMIRLAAGPLKPRHPRLGADIAGRVESVGGNVAQFRAGDEVFGDLSGSGLGGLAEYAAVPEGALALKPANITFEAAAAVPIAGITALQGLRDKGRVRHGQRVLINGASGGVGTFAVQLAKFYGAEVTGVCSSRNVELVRSIGADHVIDYTQGDFTRTGNEYDLILDNVGNRSVSDYERALAKGGTCVVVGFTTQSHLLQVLLLGSWVTFTGSKRIGLLGLAKPDRADLDFMAELLERGDVVPVIDRIYPLSGASEALGYLEKGHARGKVVISVEPKAGEMA